MLIATAITAMSLCLVQGLTVHGFGTPTLFVGILLLASMLWQPNFLRGLASLLLFSVAYATLMEAVASTANPLVDDYLGAIDAFFGLSAEASVAYVSKFPVLSGILCISYLTVMPQTCLLLVFLSDRPALWTFLRRLIVGSLLTVCIFYFLPAEGNATSITPGIAARFHELRAGCELNWARSQGIITFPSFHTIWAVLLIAGYWGTAVRIPALILNLVMIASTITTGGHYYVDVVAGLCIGLLLVKNIRR